MSAFDWNPYLVGGAAGRPDTISGLSPDFQSSLAAMFGAAPPEIQQQLRVTSGYRSPDLQSKLFRDAVAKYGSEAAARKWVAPPGKSNHNHGSAVDLKYLGDAAKAWAHQNAAKYGIAFPMEHEPWHIEPAGARGGAGPAGGEGGLSYGAAQPNMQAPSAMALADMFGGQDMTPVMPTAPAAPQIQQVAAQRGALEQERRQALLAEVGSWFG